MKRTVRVLQFGGLYTSEGGSGRVDRAQKMLNVRTGDGALRPRFGYLNKGTRPANFVTAHGFKFLQGYNLAQQGLRELLTIEKRGSRIAPYAVDPVTLLRTEITDQATVQSLSSGEWVGVPYQDRSYWINPSGSPTVYRHEIGNVTSWTPLQDSAYVPNGVDPAAPTVKVDPMVRYPLAGSEVSVAFGGTSGLVNAPVLSREATPVLGEIGVKVSGNPKVQANHITLVTLTFTTAQDWSAVGHVGVWVQRGRIYSEFTRNSAAVEVNLGGVWTAITSESKQFVNPAAGLGDGNERIDPADYWSLIVRTVGQAGLSDVRGLRFTLTGPTRSVGNGQWAFTVKDLFLGGAHLESTTSTGRIWDSVLPSTGAIYGVRYVSSSPSTGATAIKSFGILHPALVGETIGLTAGLVGRNVRLTASRNTDLAYSGAGAQIQFLRKNGSDWAILAEQTNVDGATWLDTREAHTLSVLVQVSGAVDAPVVPPTFDSKKIVSATPFKGSMVWLYAGGQSNVRFSAVGEPERQYNSATPPDSDDEQAGANFTLAQNLGDEPLGAVAAGDSLLIVGRSGVYGCSGDYPTAMSPTRQVLGAPGGAGRFAFCSFSFNGNPGLAYLDRAGENVWFVDSPQVLAPDSAARPIELSQEIRGGLRRFLFLEQRASLGLTDLSGVRMDFDVATESLWVCLGRRALVFRRTLQGGRQWEAYEFELGSAEANPGGSVQSSVETGIGQYASASRAGASLNWTLPGQASESDNLFAIAGAMLNLDKTWLLRAITLTPLATIGASASLTGLVAQVEHSRTTGAVTVELDSAYLLVDGVRVGANLAANQVVGAVDFVLQLSVPIGALTISDLNAGRLGLEVGYSAKQGGVGPDQLIPGLVFVRVDRLSFLVTYSTPNSPTGQILATFGYLSFSPGRELWHLRSSGPIDQLEFDASVGIGIEGVSRDGGYPMPKGFWQSCFYGHENRRVSYVTVHKKRWSDSFELSVFAEGANQLEVAVASLDRSGARFSVGARGRRLALRIDVAEINLGVDSVEIEEILLSEARGRN